MDFRQQRYQDKIAGPKTKLGREVTIAGIIESMRDGIQNDILGRAERQADGVSLLLRATTHEHHRRVFGLLRDNPDALEAAARRRWAKYDEKIDWGKLNDSKTEFQNLLTAYDRDHTLPLAKAYVEWFNSPLFIGHMDCCHDPADLESGVAYTTLISHCLGSVQNKTPVLEEVIVKQLQSSVTDKTKVLARALMLNQNIDAEKVEKFAARGVPPGETIEQLDFWKNVIKEAGDAVEAVAKGNELLEARNTIFGRLTAQVGGGILKLQQAALNSGPVPSWLVKFGYMGQVPIIKVEVSGNLDEVARYLGKQYSKATTAYNYQVSELASKEVFAAKLKKAANGQARFTAFVIPFDGGDNVGWRVHSSTQPALLQGKLSMREFETANYLLRPGSLQDIKIFKREDFVKGAHEKATKAWPIGASVFASILSVGFMINAAGKLDEAVQNDDKVGEAKLYFSGAAFGTIHAVSEALEKFEGLKPKFSRLVPGLRDKHLVILKFVPKVLGFFGAGIMAWLDANDAHKAYQNEQRGIAALYGISGFVSFAGGVLIFTTYAFGLPLLLIGLTLSLAIAIFMDDKLQEWLGRCVFGKDKADKFQTLEVEIEAFDRIYPGIQAG
jgi:hypothetical protein